MADTKWNKGIQTSKANALWIESKGIPEDASRVQEDGFDVAVLMRISAIAIYTHKKVQSTKTINVGVQLFTWNAQEKHLLDTVKLDINYRTTRILKKKRKMPF